MFRTVPLSIIRSFSLHTQHWKIIQVCWQLASRISTEPVPSWSCSQAVWHIPLLCVQWKTPDDRQRSCPKHVEFYSKVKFEKLVHLVSFIVRMCNVAVSAATDTSTVPRNTCGREWPVWIGMPLTTCISALTSCIAVTLTVFCCFHHHQLR